jgi:hypothetical protein
MKAGRRDLISATKGKSDSPPETKPSQDQTGCHEILLLAVVLSILKECGVELYLRPELPEYSVLEGIIPRVVSSQ